MKGSRLIIFRILWKRQFQSHGHEVLGLETELDSNNRSVFESSSLRRPGHERQSDLRNDYQLRNRRRLEPYKSGRHPWCTLQIDMVIAMRGKAENCRSRATMRAVKQKARALRLSPCR